MAARPGEGISLTCGGSGPKIPPLLFPVALDHLVYAAPDLEAAVSDLAALLGVTAAPGGRHPGWGTRNALLSLGPLMYLEIVGPDPESVAPDGPRPFSIDTIEAPRIVTWACRAEHLEALVAAAGRGGLDLGEVQSRSRRCPDGSVLAWTMTDPLADREGGIVPFFIDWGPSRHPAVTSPLGCALAGLRAVHPDAGRVSSALRLLDLDLALESGPAPVLAAMLQTPRGEVELR
jgi:hypothetical protein